jgi:RHH-type proline utilization regulon transcriptional repressor/proline dehydrogenase/delta 1-pyrroline-5-carboxylate dehydrogenase
MHSELQKHLSEAMRLLKEAENKPQTRTQRIKKTIFLASAILSAANHLMTRKEKSFGKVLSKMMQDPFGKQFTVDVTDQAFRSHSNWRAADQMQHLFNEYGMPQFFSLLEKAGAYCFKALGKLLPNLFVPLVKKLIRSETSRVILQGDENEWLSHLKKRQEEGVRVNLNHLGEAILGEEEARSRVDRYLRDLTKPEVEYVSVKASTLYSQIHPMAWEETLEKLAVPYRTLLRQAQLHSFRSKNGEVKSKFINLDMEEYKDLRVTVDLFKRVLNEAEFFKTSSGIVLQSYLPDSYEILKELTAFAKERVAKGGAPIKIRLVKGANLAMEKVEASLKCWEQAPFDVKSDVDANYKKMVEWALTKENAAAVWIGIGSHNLFDIAYAMLLREEQGIQGEVVFEMLEGMADASRKVIQLLTGEMLLYCPAAQPDEFQNAVAYLVRRLDENTMQDNFLRVSFGLTPGSKTWQHQADLFAASCNESLTVSHEPKRTQNRFNEISESSMKTFENEPDTDWALPSNRTWGEQLIADWRSRSRFVVPSVVNGEEISHPLEDNDSCSCHLASSEEVKNALEGLEKAQDHWSQVGEDDRKEILKRAAHLFRKSRGDLLGAMLLETSKPFLEGDPEVSEAIDFIEYYRLGMSDFTKMEDLEVTPKGPVLIASPWNFPCSIPTGGIAAALACGNAVVFKPAPEAIFVGYQIAKLFWEAGVPKEVLQFVPCKDEEASALVRDSRIRMVVLTGSTETAKLFLNMRPDIDLAAETGGKNALIVTALSDRDLAVKDAVQSAFGFSGQKCSACSLLVLEDEVFEDPKFKKQLKDAVQSLKSGSAWDPSVKVNPLIAPPRGPLLQAIQEGISNGEWLLKPVVDRNNPALVSPGIAWGVQPGSFLHMTELFGPILSVIKAKDLSDALSIVNQTPYGLTSGLHSLDDREQMRWLKSIQAGNLYINRGITGAIVERQPFGGCKASSFGRALKAGGPNYLTQFLQFKQKELPGDWAPVAEELKQYPKRAGLTDEEIKIYQASVGSYAFFFVHYFSHDHDPMKVLGQDNIQRYVPYEKIVIRVNPEDTDLDIVRAYAAAKLAGVECECSWSSPRKHLHFVRSVIEEGSAFVHRVGRERVRFLSKPEPFLAKELAKKGVAAVIAPVLANGRVEMLNVLREVSISKDYHRYGNLGTREHDTRTSCAYEHCQGVRNANQDTCCRC